MSEGMRLHWETRHAQTDLPTAFKERISDEQRAKALKWGKSPPAKRAIGGGKGRAG